MARFEAAGWRAYYERDWLRLLRLLVALSQEQFRIPFPRSLLAAYHVTRAAAAWAPLDHDERAVRRHYERFYRLARRYSGLTFDPARVAALELAYNDVHRRLSGRPDREKGPFLRTMTDLHGALFGLAPPGPANRPACGCWPTTWWTASPAGARVTWRGTGRAWRATCGTATAPSAWSCSTAGASAGGPSTNRRQARGLTAVRCAGGAAGVPSLVVCQSLCALRSPGRAP